MSSPGVTYSQTLNLFKVPTDSDWKNGKKIILSKEFAVTFAILKKINLSVNF